MAIRTCLVRAAWLSMSLLVAPAFGSTFIITDDELEADLFPEVAASIRENLDRLPSRRLSSGQRRVVLHALERMERHFSEDPDRNQWRIREDQRRVNSILAPAATRNDGHSAVVCKQVRDVGTRIPRTQCRSRIEIESDEFEAKRQMTKRGAGGLPCGDRDKRSC